MKDKPGKAVLGAAFFLLLALLIVSQGCKNSGGAQKTGGDQAVSTVVADSVITKDELNAEIRANPLNPDPFIR